jgi:hypothetical protein
MKLVTLCVALAVLGAAAPTPAPAGVTIAAAASKSGHSGSKAKSRSKNSLHQFTGTVTALDKTSITVEKSGKKPQTMVFTKHAEMRTQGDVGRDARVTVYYRDEDGQPVAHRVVVKSEKGGSKSGR